MTPVHDAWHPPPAARSLSWLDTHLPRPWPAAHPAYQQWTLVLTLIGLYSAFTTPFRLAFVGATLHHGDSPSSDDFNSFGLFVDLVFVCDTGAPL